MSRYQDTVIDDDEESCPLCIEEFDLSDKNFKPCPCGYQICQFCFNSLKTTYEKSTCPNCRRPYDEATIQYKIPTAEELKLDQLNKSKKQAAQKRKETEKREVETSSRKNLAGVRVKQQNLVYVIGLEPLKKDEGSLMETLRGKEYFGQYGPIEKIVVSKPKSGNANQGIGVYVTFKNKEDAATCISCVDNSENGGRQLRAQYGTTKYCSTYLRGETCPNKNCSFLHENGEDGQTTSLQNEPIESKIESKTKSVPVRSQPTPQPAATSQTMVRESSREGATSRQDSTDGSALPPTAGWANAPLVRARRASQAASASTASPQLTHASVNPRKPEIVKQSESVLETKPSATIEPVSSAAESRSPSPESTTQSDPAKLDAFDVILQAIKKTISNNCAFTFDDSSLPDEARSYIAGMPSLIDPFGGAKRRVIRDKENERRAKSEAAEKLRLEEQAKSAAEDAMDEEQMASGSLALGGEPEENPRSTSARGAIGRPSQQTPTGALSIDQSTNLNLSSLASQQRQFGFPNPASMHNSHLQFSSQNTATELSEFDRRAGPQYSQAQYDQISGHARHGSRYFNNESKSTNNRFPAQQQQQPYFSSGVQGPPPGLPTAGTPPVSGGGMFAHGQGFTSKGFGASQDNSDASRNRSGTNVGQDVKRGGVEHLAADPSILSARIHQGAGQQGFMGQNQVDHEFPPLPKRTESQTALHSRVSSVQSGHGIRTGTPKVPPGLERVTTPKVPPGLEKVTPQRFPAELENPQIHPTGVPDQLDSRAQEKQVGAAWTIPIVPAVPVLQYKSSVETKPSPEEQAKHEGVETKKIESSKEADSENNMPANVSRDQDAQVKSIPAQTSGIRVPDPIAPVPGETHVISTASPMHEVSVIHEIQKPAVEPSMYELPKSRAHVEDEKTDKTPNTIFSGEADEKDTADESMDPVPAVPASVTAHVEEKKTEIKRPTLRTLNITSEMIETLRRSELQAPLSTTTEKSAAFPTLGQIRQSSRQPSISVSTNISRPSTPAASDRFGLFSQDVSRAGSPPPGGSVVGSAPSRQKTKNQAKKDRREKAKKATEASETGSVIAAATPPAADEVGPIVARQKKQKKAKSVGIANPTESEKNVDLGKPKEEPAREVPQPSESAPSPPKTVTDQAAKEAPEPTIVEDNPTPRDTTPTPASPEQLPMSYTLRDFYTDASRIQSLYQNDEQITDDQIRAEIQDLLASNVSSFPKLLSEMVASGDLAKDHPLFIPPPFTSAPYKLPSDNRKGQAYLDGNNYSSNDVFGMIYLPQKEKKALYHGHAVSIADPVLPPTHGSNAEPKEDLLRRCLITPTGWVLRHLSRDESEKLLDLEERRQMYLEEFGDLGRMDKLGALEENDYVNLEGGFEEISRFGDRHGVCWVMDQDSGRGGRRQASRTNDDDYGLGEMPIDADDYDDEDDRYDDPEDEDEDEEDMDEEELDGEDLIQRVVADDDRYDDDDDEDDDLGSFANLTGDPNMSMALPPLPPSMMMNMNMNVNMGMGMSNSNAWTNEAYHQRSSHPMYGSLNNPNAHGLTYNSTGPQPGYVVDETLPPTSELPIPRSTNPNILPPLRQGHDPTGQEPVRVNLRAMNEEELGRRVKEKQREIESSRREVERLEKLMGRKGKELGKWRDGVFKGMGVSVGGN